MQKTLGKVGLLRRDISTVFSAQGKYCPLPWIICISAILLFGCSSLRHILIQSTGFDLGIYDQVVYLISRGKPPISSFLEMHHLGNHAAWGVYPLGLLYKIYPSVYWLLAVQAVSLALGALPIWYLSHLAGLQPKQAILIVVIYLLNPIIFNVNLFDFHPEVMALPAFLGAILAARKNRHGWFSLGILFVLGCKDVLSLTVAATGVWLLLFEKRRWCGVIALCAGITSFIIVTQGIIPFYSGDEAAAVGRYGYLGNSVFEIAQNLLLKPTKILPIILSFANFKYFCLLLLPVIWGLSLKHLTPMIGAIPTLALNILADYQPQKDIVAQYSLPIIPFLILTIISTFAANTEWWQYKRKIFLWSLICFLILARWSYFFTKYLPTLDTWQATREAIAKIETKGGVLTTNHIASHLTHRSFIKLAHDYSPSDTSKFEYVLLNTRHTDVNLKPNMAIRLVNQFKQEKDFKLTYQRDDVYLLKNISY